MKERLINLAEKKISLLYERRRLNRIPVEKDGTRVLAFKKLASDEKTSGKMRITIPVENTKLARQYKLVYLVEAPIFAEIPSEEIQLYLKEHNPEVSAGLIHLDGSNMYYHVPTSVAEELSKIVKSCDPPESTKPQPRKYDKRHPDGCFDGEYWLDGYKYEEGEMLFKPIKPLYKENSDGKKEFTPFSVNFDSFQRGNLFTPFNVSSYINGVFTSNNDVPFNGKIFSIMRDFAKDNEQVGYCVIFINGKIMAPVESFHNRRTGEFESIMTIFNVTPCLSIHHRCNWMVAADIGNLQMTEFFRYAKGMVTDWKRAFENDLHAVKIDYPDYDPYDDPSETQSLMPKDY